jgi:MYXO-CTERM domain-containing protein
MPVSQFVPSRFTLYLDSNGNVSAQTIKRSGSSYEILAANAQGSPPPPSGRPFTCTTPFGSANQASFSFSFAGLTTTQATEWTQAFKAGNRTVYVSMSIGSNASEGTEWLAIDLREATVLAALTQAKSSQGTGSEKPSGEGEGEAGDDDAVSGCSMSGTPRNAAGLGVLTLLGLVFLRRKRLAVRAR